MRERIKTHHVSVRLKANLDIHYKGDHHQTGSLCFLLNRERGEDVESICDMTTAFIEDPYFSKKSALEKQRINILITAI